MRGTGGPEVLAVETREVKPPAHGEILVKTLAAAVNHSDLEIRAGTWPILREPRFPYVPGLEVVGEVLEVGEGVETPRVGERVWTMMQGLGGVRAERDGGYAEHVTAPASSFAVLPPDRDPVALAALGLAGVTAYEGLRRLAPLDGRKLAITGASGGVGSAAAAIGVALGAKVIRVRKGGPELAPRSVDAVLDVVAGPLFGGLVRALAHHGRYCLVGAIAGGQVTFDAWALLEDLTLTGYSSEDLDGAALRDATRALLALDLPVLPHTTFPLAGAREAHAALERRETKGRVVLVP